MDNHLDSIAGSKPHDRENRLHHDAILNKYIVLQIEGMRRFFKIVKVHERDDYCIVKGYDPCGWDKRMYGIVRENGRRFRVFDFRKNNGPITGMDNSPRFVKVSIIGYGTIFDIGILFRDVTEIVGFVK